MTALWTDVIHVLEKLAYAITFIFLLITLSYYFLLLVRKKGWKTEKSFRSISVIIPAHNEEMYIRECIDSVIKAKFNGKKQIIVVDDGSKDSTAKIASSYKEVRLIRTKHSGKAKSLNAALKFSTGELIAVIDADSTIHEDALVEMAKEVSMQNTVAACCVVKVKNRSKFICMWLHIEQMYNSLMRSLLSKINANIVTPGPLSVYRKKELLGVNGFSTEGFSEDIDVTIRLIRKGHKIGFTDKAVAETNMPHDAKGFLKQRARFARGIINILKRHLRVNKAIIDVYTLPIFMFSYIQAIVMGIFTLYQIASGYFVYFVSKGVYLDFHVLKFFFEWFSIVGFIRWAFGIFTGTTPLSIVSIIGIISTLLTYPMYIIAILKFDKKINIYHVLPLFFMFPFWLLVMAVYTLCFPEYFRKKQLNIWSKNE